MEQTKKFLKVSVCVITYNQEKYIRQCLQSIVDQVTDFDFEVIVGEDCSTDGTRAIVQEFAERYPDIVKPIFQEKNIGRGCNNYLTVHKAAKGEYVAHVDGDDAMLPLKLQCQTSVMDENKNAPASFHLMEIIDGCSVPSGKYWLRENYGAQLSLENILIGHPNVGHSSIMYRRSCLKNFLDTCKPAFIDLHVYVALASIGPFISINKKLGLYRLGVGASTNEQVLDLAFDAVNSARNAVSSEKIINAAGYRFAKSFSRLMLENKSHDLFLRYWHLKIFFSAKNNIVDVFVENFAHSKIFFVCMANLYISFVRVKTSIGRILKQWQ